MYSRWLIFWQSGFGVILDHLGFWISVDDGIPQFEGADFVGKAHVVFDDVGPVE